MKRIVNVTVTKELEIDILDERLTQEALAEFSSYMWEVSEPHEMFEYAARMIAQYDDVNIEGIGPAGSEYKRGREGYENLVAYRETHSDIETEFVE